MCVCVCVCVCERTKRGRKRVRRKAHPQATENSLHVFYMLINKIFLYSDPLWIACLFLFLGKQL